MTAKKQITKTAMTIVMLFILLPISALDIETSAYFGNLGLPWGDTPELASMQNYPANWWVYGAKASFSERLGPGFFLDAAYETDPILRHIIRGVVSYESGFVSIGAGPMVGVFNSLHNPLKAGIHIGFNLELPGIVFLSAVVESSMGAGLVEKGDYFQELAHLKAGWYVYNAICSLSMLTKRYTSVPGPGSYMVEASTDYMFSADVHKKGSPYHVVAQLGYKDLTKRLASGDSYGLGVIALGANVGVDINNFISLNAGLDSGVYVYGTELLLGKGPEQSSFIFNTSLGVIMHFPAKKEL